MKPEAAELLDALRQAGAELPPELREAIGEDGDLPSKEAVEPLVELVARQGALTAVGVTAMALLPQLDGPEALEATLETHQTARDVNLRHNLADALSGFEVRDPRVVDILLERIEGAHDRSKLPAWIWKLAGHGNPEALERLGEWFDAAEIDPGELVDRFIIEAFAHAVASLGGELTGQQRTLVHLGSAHARTGDDERAPLADADAALTYDASTAPDPQQWLTADEAVRANAIHRYHVEKRPHPEPDNLALHVTTHALVENQIAENFPAIRDACKRLQDGGLSRHDAIHALGQEALIVIAPVIEEGAEVDPQALITAYHRISAEDYLATAERPAGEAQEERPALTYDADSAPDWRAWLAASEQDRVTAIVEHHLGGGPHPEPDDLGRHAMMHSIVEIHIAQDFPGVSEACERLQEEGLSRHEAVHLLGEKALVLIAPVIEGDGQLDPTALAKAYQEASADRD